MKTSRLLTVRLLSALLVLSLSACQQATAPKAGPVEKPSVDTAAKREEEFRWKERCAVAAERLDKLFATLGSHNRSDGETSVSEVFYSPPRNSCICEVSYTSKGGTTGLTNLLTLYDCLSREDLGEILIQIGAPESGRLTDQWTQKKAALK